jgi:hypothetical protein
VEAIMAGGRARSGETLEMTVANMSFMLDRLGQDCSPLQFLRELTQNAIEATLELPDKRGEIVWDVDWNRQTLTGIYKLCVIDTGIGMTGEEMVHYINKLSSSMRQQSVTGNYGVGAKIAAAPRNHAGMLYLSWKDGIGYMIHLWRDPEGDVYGLRQFEWPDGSVHYWGYVEDDIKPEQIKEHGTLVVLLGNSDEHDTMKMPEGGSIPSKWVTKYLNTRYFSFPEGITVKSREGWEYPRVTTEDTHTNVLRTLTGQKPYLERHGEKHGKVALTGGVAQWWILRDESAIDNNHSYIASAGHIAALYQNELYEMYTGRGGVARLQSFGVIFGYNRVVIYVEPKVGDGIHVTSNTARTQLLMNEEPLPWTEWATEFRAKMPKEITELMEKLGGGTETDYQQSIRDRLKQIRDLFKISRYRPAPKGTLALDEESVVEGGKPRERGLERPAASGAAGGGRGGRAGDIYALFLKARGVPGEEFDFNQDPQVKWVSVADGSRQAPDLEDRAAKYLPQVNLILANADFRVFTDMIDRYAEKYRHAPGAKAAIVPIVREWFQQQLIEAVLGAHALRGSRQWTLADMEKLWSEEALTAVVMPRYHVDNSVKRALGAKLGTLKGVA